MIELAGNPAASFIDVFGCRIFLPVMKSFYANDLLKNFIENTIDGSISRTEIFTKVCKLGCLLVYKPRYKCFIIFPNQGSYLETKILEFEEL